LTPGDVVAAGVELLDEGGLASFAGATPNVGIISLDANDLSWEIQGLLGYSHGAQARSLEEQLRAWRHGPHVDFIVAFFHECAFSTCNGHSSDGGVQSALAPLFARYQVDLVVQGYNHVYERANPLIYDPATNRGAAATG
jgi:hypothetical protein